MVPRYAPTGLTTKRHGIVESIDCCRQDSFVRGSVPACGNVEPTKTGPILYPIMLMESWGSNLVFEDDPDMYQGSPFHQDVSV